MQGWTATTRHGVKKKEAQKRLQDFKPFLIRFSTRAEEDILCEKSCQEGIPSENCTNTNRISSI